MTSTQFSSLADLARLPWFEAYGERVVVSDPSVGPVIDLHTHVALSYLLPPSVDLYADKPEAEHYLPACCAMDLDVYANRNFSEERWTEMSKDMVFNAMRKGGIRATHTVPNLIREMDELGIERSCLLPIDFPVFSDNAKNATEAQRRQSRIIAFGSVHPYAPRAKERLEDQMNAGISGVKVHPNIQCVRPDAERAIELYKLCGARKIPILWHCGPVGREPALGRYLTQVKWYEKPIALCPETTFILGHAGALQCDEAIRLHNKYPNVFLELSCISLSQMRDVFAKCDPTRLVFGSDWPFYSAAMPLAKVLIASEGKPKLRSQVLHENARRLLRLDGATFGAAVSAPVAGLRHAVA